MINLFKETIKENKEIKVKKNIKKSLVSSIMPRKLKVKQRNGFLIKKRIFISLHNQTVEMF